MSADIYTINHVYISNEVMKLAISTLVLAFLAVLAVAAEQPQQQVLVSYPKDTPNSVLENAKKAIIEAVSRA